MEGALGRTSFAALTGGEVSRPWHGRMGAARQPSGVLSTGCGIRRARGWVLSATEGVRGVGVRFRSLSQPAQRVCSQWRVQCTRQAAPNAETKAGAGAPCTTLTAEAAARTAQPAEGSRHKAMMARPKGDAQGSSTAERPERSARRGLR
jgi:hypothetical protein